MKKCLTRMVSDARLLIPAGLCVLCALSFLCAWIVHDNWSIRHEQYKTEGMQRTLTGLTEQAEVRQRVRGIRGAVDQVTFTAAVIGQPEGEARLELVRQDESLGAWTLPLNGIGDRSQFSFVIAPAAEITGDLDLCLTVSQTNPDAVFTLFYADSVDMGRYSVALSGDGSLTVSGKPVTGQLDVVISYTARSSAMNWYWGFVGAVAAAWIVTVLLYKRNRRLKKNTLLWSLVQEMRRYRFLLSQLVRRDFNHKYRQSVLGVLWSFLNPLLMMAVQYLVFSYLFHNAIENFPVYLMTGIIFFNFFNEASTLAMQSVTVNAGLIKKVYMPHYVYPLSQVLFALVNVAIELIPLFLLVLLTGLPLTPAALLLPLPILGIACFALGIGMILATLNVYFRDTGFLWGIAILLWTYLTPLFYPETIIPSAWLTVYHMNPMYQFIYFIRCLLLQGATPQPQTYVICAACALIPLALGFWIFRRRQNDFIYYL